MSNKELEMVQFGDKVSFMATYRVYRRRFAMAAFFAFATVIMYPNKICSSMMFSTVNPIASQLADIYNIPTYVVSLSSNGFFLMHPMLTFAQTYLVDVTNIAISLKVGCTLTLLGALFRTTTILTERFYTIILGSFVAGAGRPFIINIQGNVAKEWFRAEDKTPVMMAFSFLITCSNILGVLVPAEVFSGYKYNNLDEPGKSLTGRLMVLELEIFAFFLIPAILFFQASPPTPPGPEHSKDQFTYKQSLELTFKNRSFILLFIGYSLIMGGFHAMAVVISYLFSPFGFTPGQISYIQSAPIICGFVSSILYSIIIKRLKLNLRKVVLFNMVPVLISLASAYYAIQTRNLGFVILVFSILGFFVIPCIPLQLEMACRVLYPINQSFAVGFLLAGVHLWSFLFGEFLAMVTSNQSKAESFSGCMFLFASFFVAGVCLVFVKVPSEENHDDNSTTVSDGV